MRNLDGFRPARVEDARIARSSPNMRLVQAIWESGYDCVSKDFKQRSAARNKARNLTQAIHKSQLPLIAKQAGTWVFVERRDGWKEGDDESRDVEAETGGAEPPRADG